MYVQVINTFLAVNGFFIEILSDDRDVNRQFISLLCLLFTSNTRLLDQGVAFFLEQMEASQYDRYIAAVPQRLRMNLFEITAQAPETYKVWL